jgi:hypothetical protein
LSASSVIRSQRSRRDDIAAEAWPIDVTYGARPPADRWMTP